MPFVIVAPPLISRLGKEKERVTVQLEQDPSAFGFYEIGRKLQIKSGGYPTDIESTETGFESVKKGKREVRNAGKWNGKLTSTLGLLVAVNATDVEKAMEEAQKYMA